MRKVVEGEQEERLMILTSEKKKKTQEQTLVKVSVVSKGIIKKSEGCTNKILKVLISKQNTLSCINPFNKNLQSGSFRVTPESLPNPEPYLLVKNFHWR